MDEFVNKIICGENKDILPTLPTGSVDTIITDPPYGWSFMGKGWDYQVPSVEQFEQILRVLKPGGTMLCFAGSRTQHRMACNIEDAGFILKDCIMWLYGSGFPKATDISKQIDKRGGQNQLVKIVGENLKRTREKRGITISQADKMFCGGTTNYSWFEGRPAGQRLPCEKEAKLIWEQWPELRELMEAVTEAEREVVGEKRTNLTPMQNIGGENTSGDIDITAPATAEAILWDGWKSHGLKPAYEPIIVAMKCNDGSYANNALTHDVAGLNINAGRIEFQSDADKESAVFGRGTDIMGGNYVGATHGTGETNIEPDDKGRFPANVILDEQAAAMLDEQSGPSSSSSSYRPPDAGGTGNTLTFRHEVGEERGFSDSGGASRFFYCAKASKSERNEGCEGLVEKDGGSMSANEGDSMDLGGASLAGEKIQRQRTKNHHPTVKPLALMEYLCKLTSTPTGGIVLDPFAGSGTTLLAAYNTGRDYIGIERDPDYVKIIEARLANAKAKLGLFEV